MKSLHKKISIVVLAALLVAGGSSLQGGKAFADSFEDSDELVVDDNNRESVKESQGEQDLGLLQEKGEEFDYSVEKYNSEDVVISNHYEDVFDFSDRVEANRASLKGEQYIKVGLNVYKIVFN